MRGVPHPVKERRCPTCGKLKYIRAGGQWVRYREEAGCKCSKQGSDIRSHPEGRTNGNSLHWRARQPKEG